MRMRIVIAALVCVLAGCPSKDEEGPSADTETRADSTEDTSVDGASDAADVAVDDAREVADDTADAAADSVDVAREDAPEDSGGDGDASVEEVTVGECSNETPAGLAGCVERARWQADLATIAVARPPWSAAWQATQDLCAERFEAYGFAVERHRYGLGTNVIGTRVGTVEPDALVVVSAHYDSVPDCPGADDNGSGVAGVLEAARVLAQKEHARTLMVACWDEEERGLVGSFAEAARMARGGKEVVAHFDFEMIGYFSDEPGSQQFPAGFELLFPAAAAAVQADGGQGDFITNIGGDDARLALGALDKYGRAVELETVTLELDAGMRSAPLLADLRRSDHASFWSVGYPAIMITDSANFRNGAYHCADGDDTIDRLDPVRAAKVVQATVGAAAEALEEGGGPAIAGAPRACDVALQDCSGEAPKCSLVEAGFGVLVNGCVNAAETPVGEGEVCTRGPGGTGDDTCAPGLFCTFFGLPESSPQTRRCRRLCDASSACGDGERCVRWNGAVLDSGLCLAACDPVDAQACGEGLACRLEWLDIEARTLVPSCNWSGSREVGARCEGGPCAAGLACVYDNTSGHRECRALCDEGHACASGTCETIPYADGLGSCAP